MRIKGVLGKGNEEWERCQARAVGVGVRVEWVVGREALVGLLAVGDSRSVVVVDGTNLPHRDH